MTIGKYDEMLNSQDSRCAICGSPDPGKGNRFFCVDHDHLTGKIRGLLCNNCNRGLGTFEDDPHRLIEAANYLMRQKPTP